MATALAFFALCFVCSVHASFDGSTLTVEHYFPTQTALYNSETHLVTSPGSITMVDDSAETVELAGRRITITLQATFTVAAFNGPAVRDTAGTVPAITNAVLNAILTTVPGMDQSRILFDADNVFVNVQGLGSGVIVVDAFPAVPCTEDSDCVDDMCSVGRCSGTLEPNDDDCVYTPVDCNDVDACTDDSCDTTNGCTHTTISCDDFDACTDDSCDTTNGCTHTTISCDDFDACTDDSCDTTNGCTHTTISCDDFDACSIDSCDAATGCTYDDVDCDDFSACSIDSCNPSTGCEYSEVVCDDFNACTDDSCDAATGCTYDDVDCNDFDACTDDSCDTTNGCTHTTISCDDFDACTDDSCDTTNGCTHTTISCDDFDACTDDSCDTTNGCTHTTISCDDFDACTDDSCDTTNGCTHTTISCDDFDACSIDSCDAATGCTYDDVDCDDFSACSIDSCNPSTGCEYSEVVCDDFNACTDDSCDTGSGCTHTGISCDDFNACSIDSCNPSVGCTHSTVTCNDGSVCTVDSCDPTVGCVSVPIICDDADTCTSDSCGTLEGCVFEPLPTPVSGSGCSAGVYAFAIDSADGGGVACIDFGGDKRSTPTSCPSSPVTIAGSGAPPFGTVIQTLAFDSCTFSFDAVGHMTSFSLAIGARQFSLDRACGVFNVPTTDRRKRQSDVVGSEGSGVLLRRAVGQGDPHLLTPWGVRFDFIGEASANYVLFSAPQVQVNMKLAAAGPTVRFMTSIAVMFANETFVFHAGMHAFDNLPAVKRAVEARGGRVTLAHGWRLQVYLCDGVEVQVSASHRGSFNFLNVLFVTPGCLLAVGGALGHTYDCKYEVAPQSFEWSHSLEELFRIAELETVAAPFSSETPLQCEGKTSSGNVRQLVGVMAHA